MRKILEKIFPSLWAKVAFVIAVVLLFAGGTFVFFALRTGKAMLEQQTFSKAQSVSTVLTNALTDVMLDEHLQGEGKNEPLQRGLESATHSPDIVDAFIVKSDGVVAMSAHRQDASGRIPLEQFREVPGFPNQKFYGIKEGTSFYEYTIMPIEKKPACNRCHRESETVRGYLGIKIAMDDVHAIALDHRTMNIIMTGLTFGGLGIIIFVAITLLVIRPLTTLHSHIRQMRGTIDKLESGEETRFPLLPEPRRRDEIAELFRGFNNLLQRLNDANAIVHDLHQRQLEHADRLATAGEIATSMAHEIKNPVAGVLGALHVFSSDIAEADPRREILDEMKIQLERVNHAVNDLLAYARPNLPVFEECSINELIERTRKLLGQQTKGTHILIEAHLDPALKTIHADRKQLQQVLWNIFLNALQSMNGSGGTLTITSGKENTSVVIRVQDTGVGMTTEGLNQVFKPFFTTKHKGTGLGMTVSKRIMEQHHGSIHLSSTQGKGTIVTLVLPQNPQEGK